MSSPIRPPRPSGQFGSVRTPPVLRTDPRFDAPVPCGLAVAILFDEPDARPWTAGKRGCPAGVSCD